MPLPAGYPCPAAAALLCAPARRLSLAPASRQRQSAVSPRSILPATAEHPPARCGRRPRMDLAEEHASDDPPPCSSHVHRHKGKHRFDLRVLSLLLPSAETHILALPLCRMPLPAG